MENDEMVEVFSDDIANSDTTAWYGTCWACGCSFAQNSFGDNGSGS
jgi:hypothetical protein